MHCVNMNQVQCKLQCNLILLSPKASDCINVVVPPPLQSELCPLPLCGYVYQLDFSRAQTNGSGGAAHALHRQAFGDNFCT